MTTLPFDANIILEHGATLYVPCEVSGHVSTDAGTSNPYFRVEHVKIDGGLWHRPVTFPSSLYEMLHARIADLASQHDDILPDALRIEGWVNGRPPFDEDAVREFRMAEAAE